MRPVICIDALAVLGKNRLVADGVISALVRLKDGADLVLMNPVRVPEGWSSVEAILQGERVKFQQELDGGPGSKAVEMVLQSAARDGRQVSVVARGADARLDNSGASVFDVDQTAWSEITRQILFPSRVGTVVRRTSETEISVRVDLDGTGAADISTGIGFLDHMLEQLARHSRANLSIAVSGDLHVDEHHTIEDTAISLGQAFSQAIGEKRGIERYAFVLPMDDSLARVAFDWSGRSWLVWDAEFTREKIGEMPTEMFYHFFKSFSDAAECNLNISVTGDNEHHMIESVFKAVGRCLAQASVRRADDDRVPSTKGTL